MSIVPSKVIAAIVNFGILFLVLKHFFFDKIGNFINQRRQEIENQYNQLEKEKSETEARKRESEENLNKSIKEGRDILDSYKQKAEKVYSQIIEDAKEEQKLIMERTKKELKIEQEKAKSEIKKQVVDLSVVLTAKVLERTLNESEHRRLIEEFIDKVGMH
ncbi:ATP synthase subunit b, sodium ion specific [Clostridium tepidiprofundi DSM 19306]|uniref:ATP synthase subunit b n=1 Tax=Clostridium tepidiprofundi DSM 19306 TaxID=1121338 RepID=A0A151B535_9CLOT|nr:F0F1 ATP synthase subunit B [Clostridium tepidiprofundi]KYH34913.1 ATP synthase subunit b, sodium ion specific [Clostridium tepidiprofundi DSM 19306]